MNEIDRRLCWHEVRNELYMEHLTDWPQELPFITIAWLERYRYSDPDMGRKRYRSLVSLLKSEITEGRLLERGDIVEIRKITSKREFRGFSAAKGGAEVWENVEDIKRVDVRTILARDLAPLLQGADLGRHLSAWLEPYWLELAEEAHRGDVKGKRKTKGELVEDWLCECERRAKERGETFDRSQMPGTKAEFLELLRALDTDFQSMNEVSSLERYLKGLCTWSGGRPPSAKPLYARLFPESRILNPGAVLPLLKKS